MEKSDFSETQFTIGYLKEYLNDFPYHFWLTNLLRLPSTVTERKTGADMIIENVPTQGSTFFQFKLSSYLENRRGLPREQRKIEKDFFPCYRFKIYNEPGSQQFNRLKRLARRRGNLCYYLAPTFHTFSQFDRHFSRREIQENTAIIEIGQFNARQYAVKAGEVHHLFYNDQDGYCFMCSEPEMAKTTSLEDLRSRPDNLQVRSFRNEIQDIIYSLEDPQLLKILDDSRTASLELVTSLQNYFFYQLGMIWIPNFMDVPFGFRG